MTTTRTTDYVWYTRAILVALISTAVALPSVYQPALDIIWDTLRCWTVYNWSTFETLWTVFCYAAMEPFITAVFIRHPEWRLAQHSNAQPADRKRSKPKGMRRPSRRGWEALTYIAPLLMLDLAMIKKFADVPIEDMLASGNYNMALPNSTARHGTNFLVPSLHNFTVQSPLQTRRAMPAHAPSSRRLVLELFVSFVIYDALFFAFHLAMHVLPGLKVWHRPHHSHGEMHPQITNQLHIFERLGLVLLANFSLNIIGSHVLTRTAFVPIFVWLLVEIHSGLDLPWAYDKILPAGWGGGARKHAQHHRDGSDGLEPYFTWCDALWDRLSTAIDS